MPAPPPAASFEVVGRTGNEWQLNVGAEGVTVKVRITQKQDTKVSGLRFEIAPDGESWPGRTIRRISVAEPLSEGVNEVSVRWDGRNEEGDRAPPGLYRLYATVTGSGQREVTCADGSGRGFERFEGTSGGGLGTLIVE